MSYNKKGLDADTEVLNIFLIYRCYNKLNLTLSLLTRTKLDDANYTARI